MRVVLVIEQEFTPVSSNAGNVKLGCKPYWISTGLETGGKDGDAFGLIVTEVPSGHSTFKPAV